MLYMILFLEARLLFMEIMTMERVVEYMCKLQKSALGIGDETS